MFTRNSIVLSNNIKTPLTAISRAIGNILQLTYGQLVKQLFSNQEQGFAYDPNDLTTLYQDAAGTIPVTSAGQPVGLMLDKSKGRVATEVVANKGNPFTTTAGWLPSGGSTLALDGSDLLISNNAAAESSAIQFGAVVVGRWYEINITVTQADNGGVVVLGGRRIPLGGVGIKRIFSITGDNTTLAVGTNSAALGHRLKVSSISVKEIAGNHAYQTVSASRPILQRNATTGAYYLAFDGVDDFLQTNNIDFTATDKVSLIAGVRKYVNSARILCELSSDMNANPNSFYMTAPETVAGAYGFKSRGSTGSNVAMTALTQPTSPGDSCVLVASADISADSNTISRNGILSATSYELGSGNYGNYPLYIGRRGGTLFPFNGHLYSLIGIGRLTTDSETIALEKSIAKNVGVTLNA